MKKAIIKRSAKFAVVLFPLLFALYAVIDLISGDAITWMENLKDAFFLSVIIVLLWLATDLRLRSHSGNTS